MSTSLWGAAAMDFSRLGKVTSRPKPLHPIEIFEKLPNLPDTPNDIWRGQTEALHGWHENRTAHDVMIALNTGAGKTLVGLLIAQSLVNEGIENVVYVCATIDLVNQTAHEATKIGLEHTTRIEGRFSNDLFESGKTFCVTTYQALFNGLSAIRRRNFPGAVIFDDAHVAETMLRDAMSLRIDGQRHPDLFRSICELFEPHFAELGRRGEFRDAMGWEHPRIVLAAPGGVREREDGLRHLLEQHGAAENSDFKFSFAHLRDRLDRCAVLFGRGECELAPPFLPSLALDVIERPIRRVYLSATLTYKTDFVRAFGRLPKLAIEPRSDAGNGERLLLFSRGMEGGFSPELISRVSGRYSVLIAVPNYNAATRWAELGEPPARTAFSEELSEFRRAKRGVFLLVSRVDGIDLPHDTCRVMVLDGLPRGASLLERYQWDLLHMRNLYAARMANRIVQLFGRINRGRNDYGAFLINGNDLHTWLNNERNVALLPDLLQQQIALGRVVQEGMGVTDDDGVLKIVDSVLGREPAWLTFYGENITKSALDSEVIGRADAIETRLTKAAEAEAQYALAAWEGDYTGARTALEDTIEETARADAPLAGWHCIWLGACYEVEGDVESAYVAYRRARLRLGLNAALPTAAGPGRQAVEEAAGPFAVAVDRIVGLTSQDSYNRELSGLRARLRDLDGASPHQMEEAVRALGEALGFEATRSDNEVGTGPDVLWTDDSAKLCLGIELKTDKTPPVTYNKKDIGQGHDSLMWIANEKPHLACLGLLFVGPNGRRTPAANPSPEMWLCQPARLVAVRGRLLALLEDLRKVLPLERPNRIREACGQLQWTLEELSKNLCERTLIEMGE